LLRGTDWTFNCNSCYLSRFKTHLSSITKFRRAAAPQHKLRPHAHLHPNSPQPVVLPSALANGLPCLQTTFTRGTSGRCLETYGSVNFVSQIMMMMMMMIIIIIIIIIIIMFSDPYKTKTLCGRT